MPETQAFADRSGRGGRAPRANILSQIVRTKQQEIVSLEDRIGELKARAREAPEPRDFRGALSDPVTVSLIAEVKRRSPGAGPIRPGLDPVALAKSYAEAGASAISVLTDREYFQGSLADLEAVRSGVTLPILRKDFILSEAQVWEARAAGADAILLIVAILDDEPLRALRLVAEDLGMSVLVEAHDRDELERALVSGAGLLGINNRDLRSFQTRLDTTMDLLPLVPDTATLVSESGIKSEDDVRRLGAVGVDAVLVGETLLRAETPTDKVHELTGVAREQRPTRP